MSATHAAAQADKARAREALKLTIDSVEKGVDEAQAVSPRPSPSLSAAGGVHEVLNPLQTGRGAVATLARGDADPDAAEAQRRLAAAKMRKR